jgi:sec-independent protein translocase protein TatC
MTLIEHLRELRARLIRSALAIPAGSIVAWFYYDRIFAFLVRPFFDAQNALNEQHHIHVQLTLNGVADAFNLQIKLSLAVGALLASPIWLYQLFRFITPGMLKREKRWAGLFVLAALPLFLLGVVTAYLALPRLLHALLGFTPEGTLNLPTVDNYISLLIQLVFFFGIGFITPVLVVTLNVIGILSAQRLRSWWRWILFVSLVFAAIGNPTGDILTMFLFAIPQVLLMLIAYVICFFNDRRRAKRDQDAGFGDIPDDQVSPLNLHHDPTDERPSDLHEAND